MTTMSDDDDRIIVCYVRQSDEHSAVMRQAIARFSSIPASIFADKAEEDAAFKRILGFWQAERAIQP